MDPTQSASSSSDTSVVAYQAAMARRVKSQQEQDGAAALRLIDASAATASGNAAPRPMPEGATISIRV